MRTTTFIKSKACRFIRAQKWACLGFVASVVAAIFLSTTYLADAIYFDDPRHQNEALRAWMTPRYVAHSYDLPRSRVLKILGIEDQPNFPRRMDRLAAGMGLTLDELTDKVRSEAAAFSASGAKASDI